jgi:hypothetical protein
MLEVSAEPLRHFEANAEALLVAKQLPTKHPLSVDVRGS